MTDDRGDDAIVADDLCTRVTYATNPSAWMLTYPAEKETVAVNCATTPNRSTQIVTDARTWYDGATNFNQAVSKGDVTRTETLADWNSGNPVYAQSTTATYDVHGRPLTLHDPLNRTTSTSYTPTTDGPVTSTTSTNAVGSTTVTTVDPRWALATHVQDVNSRVSDLTYDGLGRLTAVWLPGGLKTADPSLASKAFAYTVRKTVGATYVTTSVLNNTGTGYNLSATVYDGQLRARQSRSQGANGSGAVMVDTTYDTRGLVVNVSKPFWSNIGVTDGAVAVDYTNPAIAYTSTTYDNAGRSTTLAFKAGTTERWHTTTAYGGDHTDVTPPAGGTATTTWTDARGHSTAVWQYTGTSPTGTHDSTGYTYTPAGQEASLTDALGNIWSYTYDQRQRKIQDDDPDRGRTTYIYDDANQLTSSTDSRGVTITNRYDNLGRRIEEWNGPLNTGSWPPGPSTPPTTAPATRSRVSRPPPPGSTTGTPTRRRSPAMTAPTGRQRAASLFRPLKAGSTAPTRSRRLTTTTARWPPNPHRRSVACPPRQLPSHTTAWASCRPRPGSPTWTSRPASTATSANSSGK